MRPIARQGTRLASVSRSRHSSIRRQRYSRAQRAFSTISQRSSEPRTPPNSFEHHGAVKSQREAAESGANDSGKAQPHNEVEPSEEKAGSAVEVEDVQEKPPVETRKSPRWAVRRKRVSEVPSPPPVPQWFLDKNVRLVEHTPKRDFGRARSERSIQCVDNVTGHVLFTIPFQFGLEELGLHDILSEQAKKNDWQDASRMPGMLFDQKWERREDKTAEFFANRISRLNSQAFSEAEQAETKSLESATALDEQTNTHADENRYRDRPTFIPRLSTFVERNEWPSDPLTWAFLEAEAGLRSVMSLVKNDKPSASFVVDRVDLSLQCPDPNSHDQLDEFVDDLAGVLDADLIRFDANDFAELSDDFVGLGDDSPGSFSTLGYDVFDGYSATQLRSSSPFTQQNNPEEQNEMEEDEDDEADEHDESHSPPKNILAILGGLEMRPQDLFIRSRQALNRSRDLLKMANGTNMAEPRSSDPNRDDARLDALLDGLLDSASRKRSSLDRYNDSSIDRLQTTSLERSVSTMNRFFRTHPWLWRSQVSRLMAAQLYKMAEAKPNSDSSPILLFETKSNDNWNSECRDTKMPLLVHIRDLRDICNSSLGENIVRRLVNVVRKRRKAGERIVIVGTTAQDVLGPIRLPGDRSDDFPFRTLSVPPVFCWNSRGEKVAFSVASKPFPQQSLDDPGYRRILEINLRHVRAMLRRFNAAPDVDLATPKAYPQLNQSGTHILTERILSLDEIQRLCLFAIGLAQSYASSDELCPLHIALATSVTARNDHLMHSWQAFKEQQNDAKSKSRSASNDNKTTPKNDEENGVKMDNLKESCNSHEKRLLSGVVDPKNIKTHFADVHAPNETVEALKTLTSLSLLRPDAFKYGVLANDRLPGLLLYGPPGTGKTLLAKAVAKDSQATVLEVTGAQVYEKYVGEGEKMVRAIFSLAKKLSPCVVFIDEADSIFGSRSNHANRNTHREIINQFLREWDGMDDHSVLLVLASNRPFDLDDAVLRRIPRRLLVDLPVAKDRESILGIHLKDENLDESISLSKLAEQTPLYSGSDLKNLSVAAALACVREENELSEARKDDADFKLPERRTLTSRHFEKALAEISASISENMSSLGAIRKFDEQYGDRKGRRKTRNYGFGTSDGSIDESAARVRQSASPPP